MTFSIQSRNRLFLVIALYQGMVLCQETLSHPPLKQASATALISVQSSPLVVEKQEKGTLIFFTNRTMAPISEYSLGCLSRDRKILKLFKSEKVLLLPGKSVFMSAGGIEQFESKCRDRQSIPIVAVVRFSDGGIWKAQDKKPRF